MGTKRNPGVLFAVKRDLISGRVTAHVVVSTFPEYIGVLSANGKIFHGFSTLEIADHYWHPEK
jgi:hypothetical protein